VSRSPEQHAEEILCKWYPIWRGSSGTVLRRKSAGGKYASCLPPLLWAGYSHLQALLDGQQDPQALAELARGRLRSKRDELAQAVQGTLGEHHRFLLKSQLRQLDFYDSQIGELDQEIARRLGVQAAPDDPGPDPSGGEPSGGQRPLSP
jgi:hypothetical protein